MPLEGLVRDGVDGDVSLLIQLDVDDIGFINLDFGRDDRHVGDRHDGGTRLVLNAHNHRFTDAHREIGDYAVKRRLHVVLVENVVEAPEVGFGLRDPPLRGVQLSGKLHLLGLGLRQASLRLTNRCHLSFEFGLALIVVLLSDQFVLPQAFGALILGTDTLQVRLSAVQGGLSVRDIVVSRH